MTLLLQPHAAQQLPACSITVPALLSRAQRRPRRARAHLQVVKTPRQDVLTSFGHLITLRLRVGGSWTVGQSSSDTASMEYSSSGVPDNISPDEPGDLMRYFTRHADAASSLLFNTGYPYGAREVRH